MKPTTALAIAGTVTTLELLAIAAGFYAAANAVNWAVLWWKFPRESVQ
jgi:hypothetical protein